LFAISNSPTKSTKVEVQVLQDVPASTCVHVEPVSSDDWEIAVYTYNRFLFFNLFTGTASRISRGTDFESN